MTGFSTQWFMDGMLHSLQTPSHILLLLSLALLLGQQYKTHQIKEFIFLVLAVLVGILSNHYNVTQFTGILNNELILLVLALSIGLLTIMKLELPYFIIVSTVIISGFMLGLDSSPTIIPGVRSSSVNSWLIGATIGIVVSTALLSLIGSLLRKLLEGIVLRVIGSWIATSALFVLTLLLTKH